MIDDWEPLSDYDDQMEGLRLGLLSHDDTHCRHGTFVGNWAGPDYMCWICESDITDEEWLAGEARKELRARRVRALRPKLDDLINAVNASTRIDPNSPESQRLFARLVKYIYWRVRPTDEFIPRVEAMRGDD